MDYLEKTFLEAVDADDIPGAVLVACDSTDG
jgi:hypothetical protein